MNPKTLLAVTDLPLTPKNIRQCDWGMGVTTWLIIFGFCVMAWFGYWELDTLVRLPVRLRILGSVVPFLLPAFLALLFKRLLPAFALGVKNATVLGVIIFLPMYLLLNFVASEVASR